MLKKETIISSNLIGIKRFETLRIFKSKTQRIPTRYENKIQFKIRLNSYREKVCETITHICREYNNTNQTEKICQKFK